MIETVGIGRQNYSARLRSDETAYVQIIASPDPAVVGQIYALDHVRTTFGATTCANIALASNSRFPLTNIARNNTHITRDPSGAFCVTDFNGGDTTAVNGTLLRRERRPLTVGDVINIGGTPDPTTGTLHGVVRLVFRGAQLGPDDPPPLCVPTATDTGNDFGL